MSERYSTCKSCLGKGLQDSNGLECGGCFGTGFGGGMDDLTDPIWVKKPSKKIEFDQSWLLEFAVHSIDTHMKRKTK
jgi:hypothetical protein